MNGEMQPLVDTLRDARMIAADSNGGGAMARADEPVSAEEVRAARAAAGLTQAQAALVVYNVIDNWQNWEQDRFGMAPAIFELFLLKTGQFTLREIVPGPLGHTLRLRLRSGRVIELPIKAAVAQGIAEALA